METAFNTWYSVNGLRREAVRKLRQVGFWGTVRHSVAKMIRLGRHTLWGSPVVADRFDSLYGTDTGGLLGVGYLDIPEDRMEHAVQYGAISDEEFTRVIEELPIACEDLTFVDLGSGKGRALLLASLFPFKQIIGVELSRMLHTIALRNIAGFTDDKQRCRDIQSVHADASTFELPAAPLLCFLYHPFDDYVMRAVVRRIEESLLEQPRAVYVWYVKPDYRRAFDETPALTLVKETDRYVFYESNTPTCDGNATSSCAGTTLAQTESE
jgi:hypothetical protein